MHGLSDAHHTLRHRDGLTTRASEYLPHGRGEGIAKVEAAQRAGGSDPGPSETSPQTDKQVSVQVSAESWGDARSPLAVAGAFLGNLTQRQISGQFHAS